MSDTAAAPRRRSSPPARFRALLAAACLLAAAVVAVATAAPATLVPVVGPTAAGAARAAPAGGPSLVDTAPDLSFVPRQATPAEIDRVEAIVGTTYGELVDDWSNVFDTPTTVTIHLVRPDDPPTWSACSDVPVNQPLTAFFCPGDDTVWLNDLLLVGFVDRFGDYAVATVVAHEYGHVLQWRAGAFQLGLPTEDTELHADCLAGLFAHTELLAGRLSDADAAAATAGLQAVGDTNVDSPNHHGTPAQRVAAWSRGFAGESCPLGSLP